MLEARTKRVFVIGAILCLIFWGAATKVIGATKLDIKSEFEEKWKLRNFKAGLIGLLKADGYDICELGEKYAVWLTECNGYGDYCIKVELCKPSMVSWRKRVIHSKVISFSIPITVVNRYSNVSGGQAETGLVVEILAKVTARAMPGGFIARSFYRELFLELYKLIRREPSPREMAESVYGGAKLRDAVRELLSREGR